MSDSRSHGMFTGTTRVFQYVGRQPSLGARLLMVLLVVLALAAIVVIVVPAVVIGGVIGLGVLGARRAGGWLARMRRPNGAFDGRRNVRVIVRE